MSEISGIAFLLRKTLVAVGDKKSRKLEFATFRSIRLSLTVQIDR